MQRGTRELRCITGRDQVADHLLLTRMLYIQLPPSWEVALDTSYVGALCTHVVINERQNVNAQCPPISVCGE